MKHIETKLTLLGREHSEHFGCGFPSVSPPVHRASTLLFPNLEAFDQGEQGTYSLPTYGRFGNPTQWALENALCELNNADKVFLFSSGLSAITNSLLGLLEQGAHALISDSVYGPTRKFCDYELKRYGVEITYYDPRIGANIKDLFRPDTKLVYLESPGSLTFEVQDISAIAQAAHDIGAVVVSDDTWGTPLFLQPHEHGIDVSIQAVTKYISGHSDLLMGAVSVKNTAAEQIMERLVRHTGDCVTADNCYLALRGLRTLAVRMQHHQKTALEVAHWLQNRPEVLRVLHPAMDSHPDHQLWQKHFTGASGVFSVEIKPCSKNALAAMLDHLELLGLGFSWGGFESLIIPFRPALLRTATSWAKDSLALRLNIGLEHADDLIADLEAGFRRMKNVG